MCGHLNATQSQIWKDAITKLEADRPQTAPGSHILGANHQQVRLGLRPGLQPRSHELGRDRLFGTYAAPETQQRMGGGGAAASASGESQENARLV